MLKMNGSISKRSPLSKSHPKIQSSRLSLLWPREKAPAGARPERGKQVIRLVLENPRVLRRIRLEFSETENSRTQEFTLRWSRAGGPLTEIVRQQWSFSPQGSTSEVEDYQVNLDGVSILELALKPDLTPEHAFATLAAWRVS